ncbi:Chaperone protein DnaK [Stieleria neptunia]|uniref:Chaperone protein DnaK n=1 Tax=Stieleria neptunia TaxID=2527979 RepID=A0A518HIU9_9BACT|nr:Hsp70 family protein [Stieleria neptunia]QDV40720.1 Chaperone protein DnaK [Stieleria neptunia]
MTHSDPSPVIGIDLGTTNSVVAVVNAGQPKVLAVDGASIMPSVVGIDPSGKLITGLVARNQQVAFPDRTVTSVKRQMGQTVQIPMGDQEFSPPEISAIILRRLKDHAAMALGVPVDRAVITVPAFFDENQRQATRHAGELAGLKVERIINEPTAATLAYHVHEDRDINVVVYDFGGGTFDVSIARMESGVIEVISSRGDTALGGDDLDLALMNHVADGFQSKHAVDLREDTSARWRLLHACESAKRDLSTEETVTISEEFIAEKDGQPLHLSVTVSRDEYETLISGFIDRTIECVDQALRDAKLTLDQIDELVLVGGSTRTPLVESRLRQEFGLAPCRAVDPDLAVALGAAIQGAMIEGQAVDAVLVDVATHTLGIAALAGSGFGLGDLKFVPILHRGSPLPARYEDAFFAVSDDQKIAEIKVYQGEHDDLKHNKRLGKFDLPLKDPTDLRGKIVVRFELTLDGTLKVTATQSASGISEELSINNALSESQEEGRADALRRIDDLFETVEPIPAEDASETQPGWQPRHRIDAAQDVADPNSSAKELALIAKAIRVAGSAGKEDAEELHDLITQLKEAVDEENDDLIDALVQEIEDVIFYVEQ